MNRYNGMPELLEQYMVEQDAHERWVTVQELRDRFSLTRYQCNTVSGFLRRLEFGSFGRFPYIVARIEQAGGENRSDPPKCRYLVKHKPAHPTGMQEGSPRQARGDLLGITSLIHHPSSDGRGKARTRGSA